MNKRSERIQRSASNHFWRSITFATFAACFGFWSPFAWLVEPVAGAVMFLLAVFHMIIAASQFCGFLRLNRLAAGEARYEDERMIRPRL